MRLEHMARISRSRHVLASSTEKIAGWVVVLKKDEKETLERH